MYNQDEELLNRIAKEKQIRAQIEKEGRRDKEPNLLNLSVALDHFYFLNKLRVYCAYLSYKRFTNPRLVDYNEKNFLLQREVLREIDRHDFNDPLLEVYNNIRHLFESIDEPFLNDYFAYKQIIAILDDEAAPIPSIEIPTIHAYLSNYCIYKINQGHPDFQKKFLTHNIAILNELFGNLKSSKFSIPPATFKNIVSAALYNSHEKDFFDRLSAIGIQAESSEKGFENGFEWTEKFIHLYKDKIDGHQSTAYHLYSEALLNFYCGRYAKAYRLLDNPLRLQGMFINLDIRLLHLIVLYELFNKRPLILENDEVEIPKVLESFRGLIRDDRKRKQQMKTNYLLLYKNFCDLYRKLYQINLKYGGMSHISKRAKDSIKKLEVQILESSTPFKNWLLQKVKEF